MKTVFLGTQCMCGIVWDVTGPWEYLKFVVRVEDFHLSCHFSDCEQVLR